MSGRSRRVRRERRIEAVLALAGGACILAAGGTASACELKLVRAPEPVRIAYDPFAFGVSSGPLDLDVENTAAVGCDLELLLTDATGAPVQKVSPGGVDVEFRPRDGSAVSRDLSRPGVFSFKLAAKGRDRLKLDATVVKDAVAEAGSHVAELRYAVRPRDGQTLATPAPLQLVVEVTPRAQINIAGAAGAFGSGSTVQVIDFGPAATGAVKRAFLQIRANTKARVSFSSEHHGVLLHEELKGETAGFSYQLAMDGTSVDLSLPTSVDLQTPRTVEGRSLPLDFTLGTYDGQVAGKYVDIINVVVSPN